MYLEYFETTADDFMEHCNWNEPVKEKMRQPVAANGHDLFGAAQAQTMANIAWYIDPYRPVEVVSIWDEAAKTKMRKPVLTNGQDMSDEILNNLIIFSSQY